MAELKRETIKMLCSGMAPGIANDLPVQGKFNFLENIRVYTEGVLESRPVIDSYLTLGAGSDPLKIPHTIKTIIDKASETFNRIVGQGTKIFTGNGLVLAEKDSGYSGTPMFTVDFRPVQSVEAYLYIADENKFRKISVSDDISDVGIEAPLDSVTWTLGSRATKIIDKIDIGSAAEWNNLTGNASAPTEEDRVNTTVTAFLADGALPNWASIVPAAFTNGLQKDSIITINAAEDVIVEEIIPAAINSGVATISKISYDIGATGLCTIVLSVSSPILQRNSILLLNGTEYVRVEDILLDGNNIPSIRTRTVGTFVAGNTVSGVASFRFRATAAYVAGNTITSKAIKSAVTAGGISSITRIFDVDMMNTGAGGKPLTPDDVFHISLLVSDPSKLTEVQIQLDVDSTTNDFTLNYYYYPVNPNFFTGSVQQTTPTISVIQQVIQRQQLLNKIYNFRGDEFGRDYPTIEIPPIEENPVLTPTTENTTQTALGQSQWTELHVPLRNFIKVGSDNSRDLKNVKAVRVSVNTTDALDIFVDSLWVGGADALESISPGLFGYNYIWRVRDPKTRAKSNWSPPLRTGIKISRGRILLNFPNAAVAYPASYKIDIARWGGTLNDFRVIGSIDNNGSTYTDTSSDRIIADNERAGRSISPDDEGVVFDFYKPFTLLDTPKKGTCDVIGTKFIWKTGDQLKTSYPRGTQIVVNGIANRFFTRPTTGSNVELERDMGALTDVVFEIQDPIMTGQPLPVIFGPFGEGNFGLFVFGLGDKNAAGTLYWLDGNSPDTMSNLNRLEITAPSEPLITGVMWDSYGFVYTNKRSFMIIPSVSADGTFGFIARNNSTSRGVFSKHSIVAAPDGIYSLSGNADGLYRVQGTGNAECITNGIIGNLFYRNNKRPKPVKLINGTTIYPPDFTKLDEIRLFSIEDYVFFKFVDVDPSGSKNVVLVYDCKIRDFISYDTYPAADIDVFYLEDKESEPSMLVGITGEVARVVENSILEAEIKSKVLPFAFDGGDSRMTKEFVEEVISSSGTLVVKNFYDNGTTSDVEVELTSVDREQHIIDLPEETIAKNITTLFEWNVNSGTKLFEETIYFLPRGDEVSNRSGDLEFAGGIGAKLWQGVIIQADTNGEDKELQYYDDRNILRATLTINHNGRETKEYSFNQPFISHTIRRKSVNNIDWTPIIETYITDIEPEAAKVWEGEFNTSDLTGFILIKRMAVAYRSDADSTIKLTFDDGSVQVYQLPDSNNNWKKHFFYLQPKKWKACKYRIETAGYIRPYKRACEVWMKSFSASSDFVRMTPFGGDSNITDIKI